MDFRFFLFLCFVYTACLASSDPDRLSWLRAEIARHDHLYWHELQPEITDEAYDELVAEYIRISGRQPAPWSPASDKSPRRSHRIPMLSLNKLHSEDDWLAFLNAIGRLSSQPPAAARFRLEPKYDGVAINLIYKHGHLQHALTRGDGREGLLVNSAVLLTTSVPTQIPAAAGLDHLEIRGELYADNSQFERINELRIAAGEVPYVQPRHLAAATLRIQNLDSISARQLSFVAFDARTECDLEEHPDQSTIVELLESWGFTVPYPTWSHLPANQVMDRIKEFGKGRSSLNFPTDGLVIKIESRSEQTHLGATQRAPRWAAAWKYPGPRAQSRIIRIVYNTGESGRVTPVAQIEPVEIEGIRIERISLHSPAHKKQQGYRVGQSISVHLAGGVIPAIAELLED